MLGCSDSPEAQAANFILEVASNDSIVWISTQTRVAGLGRGPFEPLTAD